MGPWRLLVLAVLGLGLGVWVVHGALVVGFPYQLEYGEGAVLTFSAMLQQGETLYRSVETPPYRACIYAPLHLWLASLVTTAEGLPSMGFGRLISTLATAGTLGLAALFLTRRAGWVAAAVGTAFFLVHPLVIGWTHLNRIDMLALAFTTAGLCLATASTRRAADFGAGACLALALMTKQSFVAAPVAVVGVFLLQDWRRALRVGLTCAALAGGGMALLNGATGGYAWRWMFGNNAATAALLWDQLGELASAWLRSAGGLAVLAALGIVRGDYRRDPIWWAFAALSTAQATISVGRIGGYYNYYLEPQLGWSVVGALTAARMLEDAARTRRVAAQALVLLQLGLGAFLPLPPTLYSPWEYLRYETAAVLQGKYPRYLEGGMSTGRLREWLQRHPGPVLAENMGNVTAFGRIPWMCDPVYFYFMAYVGMWDDEVLVRALDRQELSLVVLQKTEGNLRFTPRVIEAVLRNYVKVDEANVDSIYVPRQRKP